MTEEEEFEFRLRLERENAPKAPKTFDVKAFKERGWGTGADAAAYKAGGVVADVYSKVLPAEVAGGLGYVANVVAGAVPTLLGGGAAGKIAPVLEKGAQHLMQSAVKPILKDLKSGRAAQAIETMLEEGINVTKGGMQKLRDKITELNYEVADKIRNSSATIDKYAMWGPLKQTLDKFTKQVNSSADTATIQKVWHEFLDHPLISGDRIPVQLAQELKKGTQRVLAKKYGQVGAAEDEAQKAVARGLKDEIAGAVPQISGLNAAESKLLNALNVSERRVLIEANKNPQGLALLAHTPATWALFLADRSAAFKSLAARMLHSGKERIPQTAAAAGIAAIPQDRSSYGQ